MPAGLDFVFSLGFSIVFSKTIITIIPELSPQKVPKIEPRGFQDSSRRPFGEPKMTLLTGSEHEAAKSTTTVYHPMSSQRVFGMFFAIFGSPLGSPKPPKIDFFLKKTSRGMLFCRLLPRIAFTLIFWTIFHRFWMKFERKNRWFFQAVLAFSHLAKTMRFAGYPA